jgi:hypothetical protein
VKKLVVGLILFGLMGVAVADPYGHGRGRGYYGNNNWVAPALVGGLVGYAIARQQQPVVVSPQYYGYYPTPPVVGYYQPQVIQTYRYETIFDAYCNCYRTIAVPN